MIKTALLLCSGVATTLADGYNNEYNNGYGSKKPDGYGNGYNNGYGSKNPTGSKKPAGHVVDGYGNGYNNEHNNGYGSKHPAGHVVDGYGNGHNTEYNSGYGSKNPSGPYKAKDLTVLPLMEKGKLTICTAGQNTNFDKAPTNGGAWTGFDIDILSIVASEAATCGHRKNHKTGKFDRHCTPVEIEVKKYEFPGIWLDPIQGHCDIAASAISITEERRAQGALFSYPYFRDSIIFVENNLQPVGSLAELCATGGAAGKLGYLKGTLMEEFALTSGCAAADLMAFPATAAGNTLMYADLAKGFGTGGELGGIITTGSRDNTGFAIVEELSETELGFSAGKTKHGVVLIEFVNKIICQIFHDGRYAAFFTQYFGTLEAMDQPVPCDYVTVRRKALGYKMENQQRSHGHGGNKGYEGYEGY